MQEALAEAIAARAGTDLEQDMYPRWSAAGPPVPLGPLLQRALGQLTTACFGVPAGDAMEGRTGAGARLP